MRRHLTALVVVAALSWFGCPTDGDDDDGPATEPEIHVTPGSIEFGPMLAGESASFPVTIANTGDATLTLEDLRIDGDGAFSLDDGATERLLEPDASTQVDVVCAPTGDGEVAGEVHVVSDDADEPDVVVPLSCVGMAPVIEIDPVDVDFGELTVGYEAEIDVTVSSVGSIAFRLEELIFAPTSDEMAVSYYFETGNEIEPGQSETVTLHYDPRDEIPDTGYLTLYTNMPESPTVTVTAVGSGVLEDEVTDEYEQTAGNNEVDVLWVVNDSASMADELAMLQDGALWSPLWDILAVLDIDWQFGVVTTSDHQLRGAVPIVTPATPDVEAAFLDALFITPNGSSEAGLEASALALTPPLAAPGGANDGFLREDAGLRVIYVADEDDESPDPVADYVQVLQSLKVNPDHVILSALVDPANATRYGQAVASTGGLQDELSNPNWANLLGDIAWLCLCFHDTFELSRDPVVETISVSIDGAPVYVGWYYDAVINAVVFDPDYIPGAGDMVTITYNPQGSC